MPGAYDAFSLGLGDPVPFSAEHGEGLSDLFDAFSRMSAQTEEETRRATKRTRRRAKRKPLKVAIIGRPNAGKSTLINRLIGEERLLTGPEAGITRDAIAIDWAWRGRADPALRHGRAAQARARAGQAREAVGRRRAPGRAVRRGRRRAARRHHPVREAGPHHRRSHRAGGAGARHRPQQVGSRRRPAGAAQDPARGGRPPSAAGARRAGRADLGPRRRGARPADGGGVRGCGGVEPAHRDGAAQRMAGERAGKAIRRRRCRAAASRSAT